MRIVIDTNVLISAALKPSGNEARVIAFSRHGWYTLCYSTELEQEYREVAQRKKFDKWSSEMSKVLGEVLAHGLHVTVVEKPVLCSDPDDDAVLGCAIAAGASYLVTGNLADYPAGFTNPKIVNTRQFLDAMGWLP